MPLEEHFPFWVYNVNIHVHLDIFECIDTYIHMHACMYYACIHTRKHDYVHTFFGFTQYTLTCTYVCMHEAHVFVYV